MAAEPLLLYSYWRSSSSYRVRIALNLKGLDYRQQAVHLTRGGGEQKQPDYRAVNPLGLVPALVQGERVVVQSVAICEYLEETFPVPALLPADAAGRARVRAFVQTVADEIQPLNNLAVLQYLEGELRLDAAAVKRWYGHWIRRGFSAIENWLADPATGTCCQGDQPTLADCFLVPQVYNAERFECDLEPYPRIMRVAGHCRGLETFQAAAPENQPDAGS
jgi:maleylacetoacetate isomerase